MKPEQRICVPLSTIVAIREAFDDVCETEGCWNRAEQALNLLSDPGPIHLVSGSRVVATGAGFLIGAFLMLMVFDLANSEWLKAASEACVAWLVLLAYCGAYGEWRSDCGREAVEES